MENIIEEYQRKEKERIKVIKEQVKKGCNNCSQWDDYNGCTKCESTID